MSKHILTVLNYFAYFSYAPSFQELYTFFPKKITQKYLKEILSKEVKQGKILRFPNKNGFRAFQSPSDYYSGDINWHRYTLPQYSINVQKKLKIKDQNEEFWAVKTVRTYLYLLKYIPSILFIGVTGKSAMRGIHEDDDVDLFLITKKDLLWTTRFVVIILAKILGIHTGTGVCLNLFFDESDLNVTPKKQNSYIAHEILQMKPIIDKVDTYRKFLEKNKWIYQYYPNNKILTKNRFQSDRANNSLYKYIDRIFKSFQLPIILKNKTALLITGKQLWLFKKDFEKKLKRHGLVI